MLGVYWGFIALPTKNNGLNSVRISFYIDFGKVVQTMFHGEGTCHRMKNLLSSYQRKANFPKSIVGSCWY